MGYYFYYQLKNKIFVSRNAEFFENSFMVQEASGSHKLLEMSGSDKGLEIFQKEDTQPSENTSKKHNKVAPIEVEPQNVKVAIRRSTRISQVPDRYGYYVDIEEYELGDLDEPPNYKAALADPESERWLEAMNTEMQSMKDNQVWYLVDLPSNGRTIGCKWIFKKKTDMDDIRAIRILLAITAFYNYEIWKMEVKTAFLNGHLSEDVYMVQPEGFVDPKHPNKYFSMKDLGEAAYILGIKIICDRSRRLIALSQSAYLKKILKKFRMENFKKGYTPMMEKPDYRKSQGAKTPTEVQRIERVPYASAISSIMYAVRCTRPDVAFAQNLCSHFQQNPGEIYWTAVKTILNLDEEIIDGLGGVMPSNKRPMEMLCDNESALAISSDPEILKGARNVQRKYHYIREVIQEGEIVLKKVYTDDNVADPFTKLIPLNKHFEHAMAIGIVPASSLM
ncbi:retrotransposon protein, putative, ty1-copia subclass [Tanacetum coccineum]